MTVRLQPEMLCATGPDHDSEHLAIFLNNDVIDRGNARNTRQEMETADCCVFGRLWHFIWIGCLYHSWLWRLIDKYYAVHHPTSCNGLLFSQKLKPLQRSVIILQLQLAVDNVLFSTGLGVETTTNCGTTQSVLPTLRLHLLPLRSALAEKCNVYLRRQTETTRSVIAESRCLINYFLNKDIGEISHPCQHQILSSQHWRKLRQSW